MVYHKHQFFAIIFRSYFPFSFFSFLLKFGNQFDRKVSLWLCHFSKNGINLSKYKQKKELTIKISSFIGGATRNRTGDRGVADLGVALIYYQNRRFSYIFLVFLSTSLRYRGNYRGNRDLKTTIFNINYNIFWSKNQSLLNIFFTSF